MISELRKFQTYGNFRFTEISDLRTPLFPEGSVTPRFYCSVIQSVVEMGCIKVSCDILPPHSKDLKKSV